MKLKEEFTLKQRNRGKQTIKYDLNIAFLTASFILLGSFVGDFLKEVFSFKYYYFFEIGVPIISYLILRFFLRETKK